MSLLLLRTAPLRTQGCRRGPSGECCRLLPTGCRLPALLQVVRMSEAEVIRCAGVDAAMYIKILRMGG